jgi:hypothetical protein
MEGLRASLKPGVWGAVIGSILTMIMGFGWGGWTTAGTARQAAMQQADAAVLTALVPICVASEKADLGRTKKLAELTAITSSYEQTEFVMKAGWATFPGQTDANRPVAEACVAAAMARHRGGAMLSNFDAMTARRTFVTLSDPPSNGFP